MKPSELVNKYLGKQVLVKDKAGIGVVYAVLVRPKQFGPLLKIAFGKPDYPVLTVDQIYYNLPTSEFSCGPSSIRSILDDNDDNL